MNLILVTGCPGSGKSGVSKYLSEKLNYPVLSKDSYKKQLFEEYGFRSSLEKKELDNKAETLFFKEVESKIKENTNIVVDKWAQGIEMFGKSILSKNVNLIVVRLVCKYVVLHERINKRISSGDRPLSFLAINQYPIIDGKSIFIKEMTLEEVEEKANRPFSPNGIANLIEVDTTDFSHEDNKILENIYDFVVNHLEKSQ